MTVDVDMRSLDPFIDTVHEVDSVKLDGYSLLETS